MSTDNTTTAPRSDRSLLYIGAGVVALVVLTAAVVLLGGRGTETELTADSPEATLQQYLAAVEASDAEGAYAFFSADVQARMDLATYRMAFDAYGEYGATSRSVYVDRTTGDGSQAVLHLTVEEFYGEGLQGNSHRSPREIRMIREQGDWRIDEALVWLDPAPIDGKP